MYKKEYRRRHKRLLGNDDELRILTRDIDDSFDLLNNDIQEAIDSMDRQQRKAEYVQ